REGFSFQGVFVLLCVCVSLLLLISALLCFSAPICGYISPGMKRREAALLLVSTAVLAYQVLLMRAFSIGQWHHFAYMVISIALLGFGASGTLLALLQRGRTNTARSLHDSQGGWFAISATSFAVALPISFWLTQRVPFDAFLTVWG